MNDTIGAELRSLRDQYTEAVNSAVGENRQDLVEELVASYPDAALRVLSATRVSNRAA